MSSDDFVEGMRVRLARDLDYFNLGFFAAGITGTVVSVIDDMQAGPIMAEILLDERHPALDEWDNELHCCPLCECSADYWEPIVGFV